MESDTAVAAGLGTFALAVVTGLIVLMMWGCPKYSVYSSRQSGMAQLAEAESNRQIAIQEARAKEEAAHHLAAAEIARAEGIAKANAIIGGSLKQNHEYLTWLWIEGLQSGKAGQVIYVPTEANMPVLEASRFNILRGEAAQVEKP